MAAPAVRRADFLMALAYATDLATGHSRDFALRSCVLAMRLAEVAGLDEDTRRTHLSPGAAALHRLQCRHASAGGGVAATRSRFAASCSASTWATSRNSSKLLVRAITRTFADAPPEELAEAVERGLAEATQVSVPILSGHCEVAQRIAERIGLSGGDPRKSRPDLRALGRKGNAAGPVGQCGEVSGAAGDAGAGRHRAERSPWLRDHDGR